MASMNEAVWNAGLAALSGWQPIATAPKDGTKIWAWMYDNGIRLVQWATAEQNAMEDDGEPEDYISCWLDQDGDEWGPKFWMPYDAINAPPGVILVHDGHQSKWRDEDAR